MDSTPGTTSRGIFEGALPVLRVAQEVVRSMDVNVRTGMV